MVAVPRKREGRQVFKWRHPNREMTCDGPVPFDRAWLMKRLKLYETAERPGGEPGRPVEPSSLQGSPKG